MAEPVICESCGGRAIRLPYVAEFGLCSECYVDFHGEFLCCAVNMEARSDVVEAMRGVRVVYGSADERLN